MPRNAVIGWVIAYTAFLVYASLNTSGFLFIDHANLMIHEAGHALFGWAGYHTQILGGTIGQLLAPLAWMLLFIRRGHGPVVSAGSA